ncbi:hypothetical protein, variant [Sphaeroforma arctica JP610]|uniref:FFD box profile domain-containing protein n=1 Tax=Sphaeroforma arctica JP610 TaxID=667725 RepID=A0A0L0GG90_9EUKA|nr:hypothetical protein, variant [Sphaeroforma arctica JP610]KNC87889.1 hypothetical protein, variant [Sphaeroforma arctica JP610]|eukprot:XP_014161792.1 hypothetical protein, variant [Sphaeroforma arctica JP610]
MSSGVAPYLGSKISLVSKSNIRYEGVLYTIDPEKAAVALSTVVSFGTEGRRGGVDEVPPSNEVYSYITFRGADIKDLHVVDTHLNYAQSQNQGRGMAPGAPQQQQQPQPSAPPVSALPTTPKPASTDTTDTTSSGEKGPDGEAGKDENTSTDGRVQTPTGPQGMQQQGPYPSHQQPGQPPFQQYPNNGPQGQYMQPQGPYGMPPNPQYGYGGGVDAYGNPMGPPQNQYYGGGPPGGWAPGHGPNQGYYGYPPMGMNNQGQYIQNHHQHPHHGMHPQQHQQQQQQHPNLYQVQQQQQQQQQPPNAEAQSGPQPPQDMEASKEGAIDGEKSDEVKKETAGESGGSTGASKDEGGKKADKSSVPSKAEESGKKVANKDGGKKNVEDVRKDSAQVEKPKKPATLAERVAANKKDGDSKKKDEPEKPNAKANLESAKGRESGTAFSGTISKDKGEANTQTSTQNTPQAKAPTQTPAPAPAQPQTGKAGGSLLPTPGTGGNNTQINGGPQKHTQAQVQAANATAHNNKSTRGGTQGSGERRRYSRGGARQVANANTGAPVPTQKPTDMPEFDMQTANEKFDKEEIEKEFEEMHIGDGAPTAHTNDEDMDDEGIYDKKKSFFDNLSSDIVDRQKEQESGERAHRMSRGEERRMNVDTFGNEAAKFTTSNYRGRGRGRGGYNNNYRGRGGRGAYSMSNGMPGRTPHQTNDRNNNNENTFNNNGRHHNNNGYNNAGQQGNNTWQKTQQRTENANVRVSSPSA